MDYKGFPARLHHTVPSWVGYGAIFHIRIRIDRAKEQRALTDPALGRALLDSARFYEATERWSIILFVLMPDHVHALLSFAPNKSMSQTIGEWKHFHKDTNLVRWQENYFDHRLRPDERGAQLEQKANYIRRNPVAAGLCATIEDWPWRLERL